METIAYLQLAQEHKYPENKEITLPELKLSGKLAGTLLGVAGAALSVGLADAPAQAYGYGGGYYDKGCYDDCNYPSFVSGGYQVTTFKTYEISYENDHGCYDYGCGGYKDISYDHGCYDYGCGGHDYGYSYGGGYDDGCYDDYGCGVSYGGGYGYDDGCYDYGCGVSYDKGCYDDYDYGCGGGYPVSYDYGYGGDCYDYCGVSSGYSTYDIQVALTYAGFGVHVDGVYGAQTDAAVRAFQIAVGLHPDGVVGPHTASALGLY